MFKTCIVLLLCCLGTAAEAAPTLRMRNAGEAHPVLGQWQWTRSENSCTEMFDYKIDGTVTVVSGDEHTDNTYSIARLPDAQGFYAMTLRITKDHGGKDCADTVTDDTGHESQAYLLFEPGNGRYLSCREPNLSACYGPLKRVAPPT